MAAPLQLRLFVRARGAVSGTPSRPPSLMVGISAMGGELRTRGADQARDLQHASQVRRDPGVGSQLRGADEEVPMKASPMAPGYRLREMAPPPD